LRVIITLRHFVFNMRRGSLLIVGIWLVFSCNEIKECDLDTSTDYAIVKFYRGDTTVQTAKTDTVQLIQAIADSIYKFYQADTLVLSNLNLPLFPESKQITYQLMLDSVNYDLTFYYTPHLRIYYSDCDPVYSYMLDSVFSSTFDSVAIKNKILNINVSSNVELYF